MREGLVIVNADMALRGKALEEAERIAKAEGIPLSGLTILGGKPYVNVTGLDRKLDNLCREKGWELAGVEYVEIQRATRENGLVAGGWGIVKLFDKAGFLEALQHCPNPTVDLVRELRETFTYAFKMRGFASPATLRMRAMHHLEYIELMAERRATNRAKREATGTGLTSIEEMPIDVESQVGVVPTEASTEASTEAPAAAPEEPTAPAGVASAPERHRLAVLLEYAKKLGEDTFRHILQAEGFQKPEEVLEADPVRRRRLARALNDAVERGGTA